MKNYIQLTVREREADIEIYGDITSRAQIYRSWFGDDGSRSALDILNDINGLDVDVINVYINSYGGEVAEALAMYSALRRHQAKVKTFCDGFACSAATIVFCAGDERVMGSIALFMIHNCMSYLGYANSEEMRKAAEDNDTINQSSIEAYKKTTGLEEEKIKEMMNRETWLTAQEALDYGFATEIAENEDGSDPQQSAFGIIRERILNNKGQDDKLEAKLDKVINMLEEKGIDSKPQNNINPTKPKEPEEKPVNKTANFFAALIKEDE